MKKKTTPIAITLATSLLAACGGGSGEVEFTTYGEDFIEVEIPAAPPAEEGVVDGYTIEFTKFLVTIGDIAIKDMDGAVIAEDSTQKIWNVQKPGPHAVLTLSDVDSGTWPDVGASIKAASGAEAGNAEAGDVTMMNDNGYSVYIEGTGTSTGGTAYTFAWGFTNGTDYRECVDAEEKAGVVVPDGGKATAQLTIHGDHFFYDDLQSEDPSLRFKAFAEADADGDKAITLDELSQVDLTSLPSGQYGTGGDGSVTELRAFVTDLTSTLLHFQGEGHCHQHKE